MALKMFHYWSHFTVITSGNFFYSVWTNLLYYLISMKLLIFITIVKKCSNICSHFSRLTFGNFFLCWNQFTLLFDIYATTYFISMALKMFRYWSHFPMITSSNFFFSVWTNLLYYLISMKLLISYLWYKKRLFPG